jgi:hypothetical protein
MGGSAYIEVKGIKRSKLDADDKVVAHSVTGQLW